MSDITSVDLARLVAQVGESHKASDIQGFFVGEVLGVADYFVVMSASNRRLVGALVEFLETEVRDESGRSPLRVEGAGESRWVLVDYGDVIVHVFLDEVRAFYEIERLYRDVPRLEWAEAVGDS